MPLIGKSNPLHKSDRLMTYLVCVSGRGISVCHMISRTVSGIIGNPKTMRFGISVIVCSVSFFLRFCKGKLANRTCNVRSDFVGYLSFLICPMPLMHLHSHGLLLFLILGAFGSAYSTKHYLIEDTPILPTEGVLYLGILLQISQTTIWFI